MKEPARDLLDDILVRHLVRVDAVLGQLSQQVVAHLLVPVGRDAGGEVLLHAGVVPLPVGVGRDRVGVGVQRVDDGLQLGVVLVLGQDANVLVVIAEGLPGAGLHHADDRADAVGELPAFLPVAIGDALAGGVLLFRVRAILVDLLEVRQAVAVGVPVGHLGARPRERGACPAGRADPDKRQGGEEYV